MTLFRKGIRILVVGCLVAMIGMAGCTPRPNDEELAKLEEARKAAAAAEQKLGDLREERVNLENQLREKEGELQEHEAERNDLQEKMNQDNNN